MSIVGGPGREMIQKVWGTEVPGGEGHKFGHVGGSEVTRSLGEVRDIDWCEGDGERIGRKLLCCCFYSTAWGL